MAEEVSTGGLVRFRYEKDNGKSKLTEEQRAEIREAYAKADERKARERMVKIVTWIVVLLIVLAGILWVVL